MDEQHSTNDNTSALEVASEIIQGLNETITPNLIEQIVMFIGVDKAQDFYSQTLLIEKNGGMTTKSGERKRTPGGVFINLAKNNISEIEQELLFPTGREIPSIYFLNGIEELSAVQLRIGIERIENKLKENSPFLDNFKRTKLLERKQLLLKRIDEIKTSETNQNLIDIRKAVNSIEDSDEKKQILQRLQKLEKITEEKVEVSNQKVEVELERQKMLIQSEADARRTTTRLKVYEKFLERESIASIIGSVLLLGLTITLVVAMFAKVPESEIIKNGFLVLLGYFFGQTTGKKEQEAVLKDAAEEREKAQL